MKISLAVDTDVPAILQLQASNLSCNLNKADRERFGCVGIETSITFVRQVIRNIGLPLVQDGERLAGYFMPATLQTASTHNLLKPQVEGLATLQYQDAALLDLRVCFAVQVVIASDFRGRGALELLYAGAWRHLSKPFDVAISQISAQNTRSFHCHVEKLGWRVLETFTEDRGLEGSIWHTVLWDLRYR